MNETLTEQHQEDTGDIISLIWMIEKLRKREEGCTMNQLLEEIKQEFKGIEHIKQITSWKTETSVGK